jgi:hypothetical protein
VEAEQQRAEGCDEEDVDEVARQAIEPRSRVHDGNSKMKWRSLSKLESESFWSGSTASVNSSVLGSWDAIVTTWAYLSTSGGAQ